MMSREELRDSIQRAAENGRVPCRALLELARRAEVPPREVGRLCDEMGLHISECQLGCFR